MGYVAMSNCRNVLDGSFRLTFFWGRNVGGGRAARETRGALSPTRPSQNAATPSPVASKTALFAKATYTSFEDMLEKEAGPLLVDFYAT